MGSTSGVIMTRPRNFADVLEKFPDAKREGDHHVASCPVADHETPQGHITIKDMSDKAWIKCHGNRQHSYQDICQAIGFDSLNYSTDYNSRREVETYDYLGVCPSNRCTPQYSFSSFS